MPPLQLEKYFTPALSLARLARLRPSPKTPILDLVYPLAKQDTYPKSRIPVQDLPSAVKNVPVIQRGAASYALPKEKNTVDGYEPFPIEIEDQVSDADLNDLRNLTDEQIQGYLDLKGQRLKDSVKATVEALSVQSLSGKLSYSVQLSTGVYGTYDVDFGDPEEITPAKLLDANGANVGDATAIGNQAADALGANGFGATVVGLCGSAAFKQLVTLASLANARNFNITINANSIDFPGITYQRFSGRYYDYGSKAWVKGIDDKDIVFVGNDAPFWLPFCSLDNAEANFAPLPFWFSQKRSPTGKGYILTGESKPFPVPIVKALCKATVLS